MATDIAEARTVAAPEARAVTVPRVPDAVFAWFCLVVANILAWTEGTGLGPIVTGLSTLVFGGCAVLTRLLQFRDDRRASRCRKGICDEADSLRARIAELEAENARLRDQRN